MGCGLSRPVWIRTLLAQAWVMPVLRLALVSAYLIGGVDKATHFGNAIAEQAQFGLHPPALWAALAVAVEILGPLAVVSNRFVWLGAGALGCLVAVAMFVANDFWNLSGQAHFMALNGFFEHLGLIAGLAMAVILSDRDPAKEPGGF
jgi:uncharacterized membrane protein YphA (DoxX/SURF4 family)